MFHCGEEVEMKKEAVHCLFFGLLGDFVSFDVELSRQFGFTQKL